MDWNDELEYRVYLQVTTWEHTFEKGEALLALAEEHPEHFLTLSASACIVLATALEQATWSKLDSACKTAEDLGYDLDDHADLMEKPGFLQKRVEAVVEIFSHGLLQLDTHSPQGQSLCRLISLRNKLLHIREAGLLINKGDRYDRWKDDIFTPPVSIPSNPWDYVTLESAHKFRDAVRVYFREVIESDPIEPGEIVKDPS